MANVALSYLLLLNIIFCAVIWLRTNICSPIRSVNRFEVLLPPCEYMVFDEDVIRSDELHKDEKDRIRHVINMFLEIFGMCEIVDTDHVPISAGNLSLCYEFINSEIFFSHISVCINLL